MKKVLKIIFGIIFAFIIYMILNNKVSAATINSTEVTIYILNEQCNEYGLYLPEDYPTEFKLEVSDTNYVPIYTIPDEFEKMKLTISEDGLIKPKKSFGNYEEGICNINVQIGNQDINVKVNIIDYLDIYIENIIEDYINKNITSSMTEYQKLEKICQFVASYKYSASSSSYQGMILTGGGDCWAASYCIIHMCDLVGVKSYLRYAANEPGAGNGHRNVSALADGKVYRVEASYVEEPPRDYTIEEEPGGFVFGWDGETRELGLIQYNGFDENVIIPSSYTYQSASGEITDELKIIFHQSVQRAVIFGNQVIKTVTLPETVTRIDDGAFAGCKDLTTINIPASVQKISATAFTGCTKLKNFNVDPNNPYFCFENGILYNKDKTEVILCLFSTDGEVFLDENVKVINEYAFYDCKGIKTIHLGNNVETIKENAFAYGDFYSINIPKSVKTIEYRAFFESDMRFCKIENGCQANISEDTFGFCNNCKGIAIPSSITNIPEGLFTYAQQVKIYTEENSEAFRYAQNNSIAYQIIENDKTILEPMILLESASFDYDGTEKKPKVSVIDGGIVLKENQDYTISYSNNINAGKNKAKVVIIGIGNYTGVAESTFTINMSKNDFNFSIQDVQYSQKVEPTILASVPNDICYFSYGETRQSLSNTPPTEVGTYYIRGYSHGGANYKSKTIWAKFNIIPADNELVIQARDIAVGSKPSITIVKNNSGENITYYYKKQNESDEKYSTTIPTQIGAYTVKAVSEKSKNYNEGIATDNFEIKENVVILGDINNDGKINPTDARLALLYYVGKEELTQSQLQSADVNKDGKVNPTDARQILLYYVGKIKNF